MTTPEQHNALEAELQKAGLPSRALLQAAEVGMNPHEASELAALTEATAKGADLTPEQAERLQSLREKLNQLPAKQEERRQFYAALAGKTGSGKLTEAQLRKIADILYPSEEISEAQPSPQPPPSESTGLRP